MGHASEVIDQRDPKGQPVLHAAARVNGDILAPIVGNIWDEAIYGRIPDRYFISKFGRNDDVDTAEDIWRGGGDYTGFPTTAPEAFEIFSSDVADTEAGTGAQVVRFFYLDDNYEMFTTIEGSNHVKFFDVTMNGTTPVIVNTTGMRIWRAKVIRSGSGQVNAGTITCRWVTTTANVFVQMPIGIGQSQISALTIPAGYEGFLKTYGADMDDTANQRMNIAFKTRDFETNTFRQIRPFVITSVSDKEDTFEGFLKFPEKSDLVMRVIVASTTNMIVNCHYEMLLVKI
ncbi:hypothetical protein KAR91_12795 [Candidatus Pacearchaeota archaeon]|nr:hypothetical protein [Candidatus Pacearchaeota archaeon]